MYELWLQGIAPAIAVPIWARVGKLDESQRACDFPTNNAALSGHIYCTSVYKLSFIPTQNKVYITQNVYNDRYK